MGAWHPDIPHTFAQQNCTVFLGGNGQFSPTKFQTTFFQQKKWKTNWNILQPSKHPGAARFLSSKPQPFFFVHGHHIFYGPGASCTGRSCWTQTKRLQASWGNATKNPMISFTFSGDACLHCTSERSTVKLEASQPCQKKNTSASEVMVNI